MSADLSGVRRKLARAKRKLIELQGEVTAYMEAPPFRIVVESEGTHQGIVCRIDEEPNESWADEMAEIAYQARSALDVLIPQLVLGSGNTPRRGTQFPIFLDRDDYVEKRGGRSFRDSMLNGVAPRFRRIIDGVQPYQRGPGAYRDPLAVLRTISNRDKHNDVYACVAASEMFAITLIRPVLPEPDRELTVRFGEKFIPYVMTDGEELFAIDWNPDPADPPAPMEHYIQIEPKGMEPVLGFNSDGRTFLLPDLDRAVLAVSQIIDRCDVRLRS